MLRLTRLVLRAPELWLLGTLLLTAALATGLSRLEFETDGAAIHPPDNPTVRQTERDREIFHDPEQAILLVSETPDGPPLRSPSGLIWLRELIRDVRRLPGVRGHGVLSVATLRDLRIDPDSLSARPFLETIPEAPGDFTDWTTRLRDKPLSDALFLSADGTTAALYVPLAAGEDRRRLLATLRSFCADRQDDPFDLALTGPLAAESLLGEMILADLERLIPLMVLIIVVLLRVLLRTKGGVLVPSVAVAVVLVWTLGAMAFVGVPVTLVTTLVPVILMAMATTDEIHLLERLQGKLGASRLAATGDWPRERTAARELLGRHLLEALAELERPLVATSLTTSVAFLGFLFTPIVPLKHFGLLCAAGILLALVLTFTTIPALAILLPVRWFVPARRRETSAELLPHERLAVRHRRIAVWIALGLVAAAVPGLMRLRVEDNWVANFDPDSEFSRAERRYNDSFWGTYRFDVVLCGDQGLFHGSQGAGLTKDVSQLAALPDVAGVLSYLVNVDEIHRAHGSDDALTTLSNERLADYLNLAMMSQDPLSLLRWMTTDGSCSRIRLFLKSEDYSRDQALAEELERRLDTLLEGRGVRYHFSGDIPVGLEMVRTIVGYQLRSLALTFAALALILLLVHPRGRVGLVALLPVTATTPLIFAGMGYVGLPLGVATSLFASLALGVGVDFSLHFLHGYKLHEARGDRSTDQALARTLAEVGRALGWNVSVLALGFLVLTLSALRPNHSLGLLLAAAMVVAYAMTLLVLPGLLDRLRRTS